MKTGKPYFIIDAPGITGNTQQLLTHTAAGGAVVHRVDAEGFLERPEAMWPGRDLEGKKVRPDGTVGG